MKIRELFSFLFLFQKKIQQPLDGIRESTAFMCPTAWFGVGQSMLLEAKVEIHCLNRQLDRSRSEYTPGDRSQNPSIINWVGVRQSIFLKAKAQTHRSSTGSEQAKVHLRKRKPKPTILIIVGSEQVRVHSGDGSQNPLFRLRWVGVGRVCPGGRSQDPLTEDPTLQQGRRPHSSMGDRRLP